MHHANKCFGTKWNLSCRRKDQVGLGIEVLEIKNSYLLSKWLYKLLSEERLWQQLLKNKYLRICILRRP
jgi:hypothetical protein